MASCTLRIGAPDQPGPLVQATDGYLYGSAGIGGSVGSGVIFRISTTGDFSVVHALDSNSGEGAQPGPLVQASNGNFYGLADSYASNVFRVTPSGDFTVLYWFDDYENPIPVGSLIQASDGNLYGVTSFGGDGDLGTIFQITLDGTFTTVSKFEGVDGGYPYAGLMQVTDGYLYGTSLVGNHGQGNVFRLPLP